MLKRFFRSTRGSLTLMFGPKKVSSVASDGYALAKVSALPVVRTLTMPNGREIRVMRGDAFRAAIDATRRNGGSRSQAVRHRRDKLLRPDPGSVTPSDEDLRPADKPVAIRTSPDPCVG